ncbi:hypothetical protein O7632_04325 [Solwaraspora sp. WMMD406]|uniref:hypothetical protein n=1 Tax=Solwaraspora sp. WMMD406 TaxID=3016095 RepID=UPI002417C021|nr:hypothetical protein [Solwaraspora sp. WMMD406]MDG4763337.1 hypothetical protein [Solwaraspora sp. WMMD406]
MPQPRRPTAAGRPATVARHGPTRRVSVVILLSAVGVVLAAASLAGLRFIPGAPFAPATADYLADQAAADQLAAARQLDPAATPPAATAAPSPTPTLPPLDIAPTDVELDVAGWWSWAMLDQRTGEIHGSANLAETSTTASLIKAWIAADFLRTAAAEGKTPNQYRMHQLEIMIRDSDNDAAEDLWQAIGRSAAIDRMIEICGLTDSSAAENRWSITRLSPRDTARLGACIADGRAAGSEWTNWLLEQMRGVRSPGDFGVIQAFPDDVAAGIAIKNGWVIRDADREWHVNCLAIGDGWTLGVMVRFSTSRPYSYGGQVCQEVADQLRTAAASRS